MSTIQTAFRLDEGTREYLAQLGFGSMAYGLQTLIDKQKLKEVRQKSSIESILAKKITDNEFRLLKAVFCEG
jgi:hypothetical protein